MAATGALAQGNVTLAAGTEDAANWTITPNTSVTQGTSVNITYNGSKKVSHVTPIETYITNTLLNSTFASDLNGWYCYGEGFSYEYDATGGVGSGGAAKINNTVAGEVWSTGIYKDLASALTPGNTYVLSFKIRSNGTGHVMYSVQTSDGYPSVVADTKDVGTSWVTYEIVFTVPTGDTNSYSRVALTMGADANTTYWVDDVVFGEGGQRSVALTETTAGKNWTMTMPAGNVELQVEYDSELALSEAANNAEALAEWNGYQANVTLTRTLQAGGWNTFCAPFSTAIPSGWTVKELSSSAFNSTAGELTLTFGNAASIEAGKPYLVKVSDAVANLTFDGVTVSSSTTTTETTAVDFVPVMNPTNLTGGDKTVLFVTGGNKLTYPSGDGNINGFRAYFQLKGEAVSLARAFRMSFDDGTTGITTVLSDETTTASGTYTLDGRRIEGQSTQKGVYIVNGKKTIVK